MQDFVCALQDWSPCFPQSCGSPIIKYRWPSRSDSLGICTPFVRTPGWEACPDRTFTTVWELLCYYCSPVCGSPTQQVWDLTLLWLDPSYLLVVAFCLWTWGIFFWWVPASSCWTSCSTARCDFGGLTEDEHTSFYSTILNQKPLSKLSSFSHIKRLFSSSSISAIRVVSSTCLKLLIFLSVILIPACDSLSLAFHMYSAYKLNKQSNNLYSFNALPF